MPNFRGGGEYGRSGTRPECSRKKQNVFDDFIARRRVSDQRQVHVARRSSRFRRVERRTVGRRGHDQRPDLFGAAFPRSA